MNTGYEYNIKFLVHYQNHFKSLKPLKVWNLDLRIFSVYGLGAESPSCIIKRLLFSQLKMMHQKEREPPPPSSPISYFGIVRCYKKFSHQHILIFSFFEVINFWIEFFLEALIFSLIPENLTNLLRDIEYYTWYCCWTAGIVGGENSLPVAQGLVRAELSSDTGKHC